MRLFKNLIAVLGTLVFSGSVYAGVTELSAYDVDKCRQELAVGFTSNPAVVLAYSRTNTSARTLELFKAVASERPNSQFYIFDLDTDNTFHGHASRLCLGQEFGMSFDTMMIVSGGEAGVGFLHSLFGTRNGSLSTKAQVEAIIDDFNDQYLKNVKAKKA